MSRRLALFAGMVVWLLMATTLRAATDGLAGPSSTGTARVTLAKGDVVLISNITDVAFPQWTAGMGAQMAYGQACVYSSTGGYLVKAISSAGGAAFALADDSGYRLPYLLNWQDRQQTPTVEIALESGLTNPTRMRGSDDLGCADNGGTNVRFQVAISEQELHKAPTGLFTDVLTLVVVPE